MVVKSVDLVETSELNSTTHDRLRRSQRSIKKIDLQRARRYGMAEHQHRGRTHRIKYSCGGMVFIYDPYENRAITSWRNNGELPRSGTRFEDPVLLRKSEQHDNPLARQKHRQLTTEVQLQKNQWKSHTVFVVDMSGSMRADDVNGARCRADGVWTAIARDFIMQKLDNNQATSFDLVSIVLMRETAQLLLVEEPLTWVLYNRIVELREWTTEKPRGPGNYLPALKKAEELLRASMGTTSALALLFFSDGRPSDKPSLRNEIVKKIGGLASGFGRRLTIDLVGMASRDEDFSVLEQMAQEGQGYSCKVSFKKPSLDADSLSQILATLSRSVSRTRTELSEAVSGFGRLLRSDVEHERRDSPDDEALNENWMVFRGSSDGRGSGCIGSVYVWKSRLNDFVKVLDPRCWCCRTLVANQQYEIPTSGGWACSGCRVAFFCESCWRQGRCAASHDCARLAKERREGYFVKKDIPFLGVAFKTKAFGEGAERVAKKFRYLDREGSFAGPRMVAKESRFVQKKDENDEYLRSHRHKYHKVFMRTQAIAARFASLYNRALDELQQTVNSKRQSEIVARYPRIRFLEPVVFELIDLSLGKRVDYNVLVEPMIEGDYRKFNNNCGNVDGNATDGIDHRARAKTVYASNADLFHRETPGDEQDDVEDERIDASIAHRKELRYEPVLSDIAEESGEESGDDDAGEVAIAEGTDAKPSGDRARPFRIYIPDDEEFPFSCPFSLSKATKYQPSLPPIYEESGCLRSTDEKCPFSTSSPPLTIPKHEPALSPITEEIWDDDMPDDRFQFSVPPSLLKHGVVLPDIPEATSEGSDTESGLSDAGDNKYEIGDDKGADGLDDLLVGGETPSLQSLRFADIPAEDFPQAFSHYSYARSGGHLMVVDLQGALQVKADGAQEFVLTDPAIHKRRTSSNNRNFVNHLNFGRTDLGKRGMREFWKTHHCNDACRLLGLRARRPATTAGSFEG